MVAADSIERRRAPRFLPAFITYCRVGSGGEGVVWNMSATGLGMLIGFPPDLGRILPVELSNHATSLFLMASVARVRQLEAGDFFVGLRFDRPLERDELEPFVVSQNIDQAVENSRT